MKVWSAALLALLMGSPAWAGSYRIQLVEPTKGRLLIGHAGVEAADDITATAKVRVVAPGNEVRERGTVRVLVMNLSGKPFEFGPDQVSLTLGDGTQLRPVSVDSMEKGRELIERERRYAGAADLRNRNNLQGLADQAAAGITAGTLSPGGSIGSGGASTLGHDERTDESMLPGSKTLDGIYQILIPLTVEPKRAWGGYYVFDVPKAVLARKADQPLTILVRTGGEEHRFSAVMKWK
jgi:hypothetical protein